MYKISHLFEQKELCETNSPFKYNPSEATVKFCLKVEDRQVCFQKSAREQQQHCWDSVGQKIFQNNKDSLTTLKKNQINMSYRGTFRKEKNQNQIWNKKEALPVLLSNL